MAFAAFWFFSLCLIFSSCMVIMARNPVHGVLFLILSFFNAAGLFLIMGAEFLAMLLVIVYVGAVAVLFLFVVMMLDVKARPQGTFFNQEKRQRFFHAFKNLLLYALPFLCVFGGGGFLFYIIQSVPPFFKTPQGSVLVATVLFFLSRFVAKSLTSVDFFTNTRNLLKVVPLPFIIGLIVIAEVSILITLPKNVPLFPSPLTLLNTTRLGHVLYTHYSLPFFLSGFVLLVAMVGAITITRGAKTTSKRQAIRNQINRTKDNTILWVEAPLREGLSVTKDVS